MCPFSYADQLMCGDEVLVHKNDELSPAVVINVSSFTIQGKYQCNKDNYSLSLCEKYYFKIPQMYTMIASNGQFCAVKPIMILLDVAGPFKLITNV